MKNFFVYTFAALFLVLSVSSVVLAKESGDSDNGGSKERTEKVKERAKNYEKPAVKVKPNESRSENAKLYKKNVDRVVENLTEVEETANASGDTEVADTVEEVIAAEDDFLEETEEAISEVEKKNKFMVALVGSDYKNLGQLRSSLVHNRNQIRKLTKVAEFTEDPDWDASIQAQLLTLMEERERIKTVLTTNESTFSVLGWFFKFVNGYDSTPAVDETEEEQLAEEVAGVVVDEVLNDDTGSDQDPVANP